MGNKLKDFRLESYGERSMLQNAIDLLRSRNDRLGWMKGEKEMADAIALRLSRTECQPGGCPYCNEDRAREEAERYED